MKITIIFALFFVVAVGTTDAQRTSRSRGAEAKKETPAQKIERLRKFSDFDWHQARISIDPVCQNEISRAGICGPSSFANGVLLWNALGIVDLAELARNRRETPAETAHRLVFQWTRKGGELSPADGGSYEKVRGRIYSEGVWRINRNLEVWGSQKRFAENRGKGQLVHIGVADRQQLAFFADDPQPFRFVARIDNYRFVVD